MFQNKSSSEYVDLRERNRKEYGQNCIRRGLIICTLQTDIGSVAKSGRMR